MQGCIWYKVVIKNATPTYFVDKDGNTHLDQVIYQPTVDDVWPIPKDTLSLDAYSRFFSREYSPVDQYFMVFYYSILYLGQNEIFPGSTLEIAVSIISLLFSMFTNLIILGELAICVTKLEGKRTIQNHRQDEANSLMDWIHLEHEI